MRGRVIGLVLLVGMTGAAVPVFAGNSCSHECAEVLGCFGGCSASTLDPCTAICWGGACSYTCRVIGPGCGELEAQGSCDQQPPPEIGTELANVRAAEWAVMARPNDAAALERARTLAASSPEFAELALRDLLAELRSGRSSEGGFAPERLLLRVQPTGGDCLRSEVWLEAGTFPDASTGTELFFRATTDPEGFVVAAEPLYARFPERASRLLPHLQRALRVEAEGAGGRSLEIFGALGIYGTRNEPSLLIAAVLAR